MKVSQEEWNKYIERLASINEKAAELLKNYVDQYGVEDLDKLSEYAYSLTEYYGKASAAEACVMYDELAKAQGAKVKSAVPADTAPFWEVRKAVYGTQGTANTVPAVQRLVKRTASDTMLKNSIRDKAQWAWIPSGDTCAFCLTLASQGWVNASSKLLKGGHAEHIHANCNCEFAIRFDKKSTVAGYNPLKYRKIYDEADGDGSREKINSIRRKLYAESREINQDFYTNILEREISKLKPGVGSFEIEEGAKPEDIKTARWMREKIGGDIICLADKPDIGKMPDSKWNGIYYEFKAPTSKTAIDDRIRIAQTQLADALNRDKNDDAVRGMVIDISNNSMDTEGAIKEILNRTKSRAKGTTRVLIRKNDDFIGFYEVEKKK